MRASRAFHGSLRPLLALTSVLVTLSLLELGLRVVQGEPWLPGENLIARRVGLLRVHVNNDYDPLLGWVLKPHMENPGGVSTIEHGIRRNGATPRPIAEGAILASGDSFTAGSEVLDHESWPAYLEQMLGVPTLNAATGAWASDQIVLRVEQLLPIVRPSSVIVSFLVDDIERSRYRYTPAATSRTSRSRTASSDTKTIPCRRSPGDGTRSAGCAASWAARC